MFSYALPSCVWEVAIIEEEEKGSKGGGKQNEDQQNHLPRPGRRKEGEVMMRLVGGRMRETEDVE